MERWKSKDRWCVYKHTSPSGKVYIGMTNNTKNRWRQNGIGYKTQPIFWRAIKKYGWENFTHEIICCDLTMEDAQQAEVDLIEKHNSTDRDFGYNVSIGGSYMAVEAAHSPESIEKARQTRRKNREAGKKDPRIGRKYPPEFGRKVSASLKGVMAGEKHPLYGKHLSEETRKKIGDAHRGKKLSEEHKRKMSESLKGLLAGEKNPNYGKSPSQETRDKISKANKGRPKSEEAKRKMSESHKEKWSKEPHPLLGRHQSEEHIRKRIDAVKRNGTHPFLGMKGELSHRYGKKASDETKMKLSLMRGKPVIQYDSNGTFLNRWRSMAEIHRQLGYDPAAVSACCHGKRGPYHNCIWKFEEDVLSTQNPPNEKLQPSSDSIQL